MKDQFDPYQSWLEIAPQGRAPTHYELLGLPGFTSDRKKIQDAATARIAHVRKYQAGQYSDVAIRLMTEISQALTCLQDPAEKAAYDRKLRGFETIDDAAAAALSETAADRPTSRMADAGEIPPLASDLLGSANNRSLDRLSALVAATEPLPNSSAYVASAAAQAPAEQESNRATPMALLIGAAATVLLLAIGSFGAYRLVAGSSKPTPAAEPPYVAETPAQPPVGTPSATPETSTPNAASTSPGGTNPVAASTQPQPAMPPDSAAMNNLKQIGLAMHNYHDVYRRFPAPANYDKQGQPLLSWRVHVLPYLEQNGLFLEFHLDEPWDSEHNRKLIDRMPATYKSRTGDNIEPGKTTYLLPRGKGTLFDRTRGPTLADITDGTSNTIMVVEASTEQAVIWTKPDDLSYDPDQPLAGLGGRYNNSFLALYADGVVQAISQNVDAKILKALFSCQGGEVVPAPNLGPAPGLSTPAPVATASSEALNNLLKASRQRWELLINNPQTFTNQSQTLTARFTQTLPAGTEFRLRVDLDGRTAEFPYPGDYGNLLSGFLQGQVIKLEYLVLGGTAAFPQVRLGWVELADAPGSRIVIPGPSAVAGTPGGALPGTGVPGEGMPPPGIGPGFSGRSKRPSASSTPQPSPGLLLTINDAAGNTTGSTTNLRVAWSPDGSKLVIGGNQCRIFDAQKGTEINVLPSRVTYLGELLWSPNGKLLAVIDDNNQWSLVDPDSGEQLATYPLAVAGQGSRMAFDPKRNEILIVAPQVAAQAAANMRNAFLGAPMNVTSVLTWDIGKRRPGEEIKNLQAPQAIALSSDGKSLVVGSYSYLYLFRESSGRWGAPQPIAGANFGLHPRWIPGRPSYFTAVTQNSMSMLWDAKNIKKNPIYLGANLQLSSFSSDGKRHAYVQNGVLTTASLEDAKAGNVSNPKGKTGQRMGPGADLGLAQIVAFSPASEHLAVGFSNGQIAVLDEAGAEVAAFSDGTSLAPVALTWSPSGDRLASSHYGKVCIWDTARFADTASRIETSAESPAKEAPAPAGGGALRPEVSDKIKLAQKAIIEMDWATANAIVEELDAGDLAGDEKTALNNRVKKLLTSKADLLIQQANKIKNQDPDKAYQLMSDAMDIDPNGPAGKRAANALKLNP